MLIPAETSRRRLHIIARLGSRCTCPCGCAETNPRRLDFHHVNGAGNQDRVRVRGKDQYTRMEKQLKAGQELDPPMTLLCLNCHGELTRFGVCQGAKDAPVAEATGGYRHESLQGQVASLDDVSNFPDIVPKPAFTGSAKSSTWSKLWRR